MIFLQLKEQLQSLSNLLQLLNNQQYNQKIAYLGNASIGGHTRHVIELLKCVLDGYDTATIDYVNRTRNLSLENDLKIARKEIDALSGHIMQPDKRMKLATESDLQELVYTSFYREIVYNAEHAVHHLALIKVALREMALDITDDYFGMAPATIKYQSLQNKIKA
ncbi:hypothetical protein [Ferruginibacter sp.]